ncbi:MAG: hypothetical protein ACXIU8_02825 [Alkalilacustris sp.]
MPQTTPSPPGSSEVTASQTLADRIARAVSATDPEGRQRVVKVTVDDRVVWVKRPERLRLRMRLQKGNANNAFAREAAALHELSGRGLPVVELVAAGPGMLAVADCGVPLRTVLRDPARTGPDRQAAALAGGAALAALHAAGVAHGRPDLRDICWDGARATLIDFERYRPAPATLAQMRSDLVILAFSAVVALGAERPELAALVVGYRRVAPPEPWAAAAALARRLTRAAPLVRLLAPLDGKRGEIAAVAPTLALLMDPPDTLPSDAPPSAGDPAA